MAEPRNNIYREYPRAAKLQLVRWREVDGIPQGRLIARATKQFPQLPSIHSGTWRAWVESSEYADIRDLVTGEQHERERLSDLFQAAGGPDALSDVADAAAYALASKAMLIADGAEDARDVRSLMQTIRDAKSVAAAELKEAFAAERTALETEHAAEIAEMQADNLAIQTELTAAHAELDRMAELCRKAGIDASGTARGEISEAAKARIRKLYGITD